MTTTTEILSVRTLYVSTSTRMQRRDGRISRDVLATWDAPSNQDIPIRSFDSTTADWTPGDEISTSSPHQQISP